MSSNKLTSHLLSLKTTPTYSAATQHNFLTLAGSGDLPLSRLALWLSQDRIYAAHAYPRFVGALISRIPFHASDPIDSVEEQSNQGILHVLVECLDNIVLEVEFFKKTAGEFQLDLDGWMERKGTRDYTAEMARISLSSSLEEGIVFLWAMERVSWYFIICFVICYQRI
jgi:thiaminase